MKINLQIAFLLSIILLPGYIFAQDQSCKVELQNLAGKYSGGCKNGFADGKGEAIGLHRYEGSFKYGLPNGKGTYHYNDNMYYIGSFQDGIKEGKGEMHYVRPGMPDSVIKGFWSADMYVGRKYTTYVFNSSQTFDSYEITPSEGSGNTVTIEISTTSGAPDGTPTSISGSSGYVLTLVELISTGGDIITKTSGFSTAHKSSTTFELHKFPAKLFGTLSDGRTIDLELYKAAKWNVRLYLNR